MNKTKSFLAVASISLALTLTFSCSGDDESSTGGGSGGGNNISYGSLAYNGQTYKTVQIGTQIWMAENLNYDIPNNDTDVCYDNDPANCVKYGRLYDWVTAMALPDSCRTRICTSYDKNRKDCHQVQPKYRGICPSGWRIPNYADYITLRDYVGISNTALKLKAKSGWSNSGNGTDDYGFSALPGGYLSGTEYYSIGASCNFWMSTDNEGGYTSYTSSSDLAKSCKPNPLSAYDAWYFDAQRDGVSAKSSTKYSIRCVQDATSTPGGNSSGSGSSSPSNNCGDYQFRYNNARSEYNSFSSSLATQQAELRKIQNSNPNSVVIPSMMNVIANLETRVYEAQSKMTQISAEARAAGCTVN